MLQRDKGVTVQRAGSLGWLLGLRPNHLFPPFEDPAIRRALLGAIDQTAYVTAAVGADPEDWQVPTGFFPIASPMACDVGMAALTGPRDLGKTRKDLEAAGYRGEKIVALVPVDSAGPTKGMTDVAVDMLRHVGVNVDYQAVDFAALVQRVASKNAPDHGGWNIDVTGAPGMDWRTPATHRILRANGVKGHPAGQPVPSWKPCAISGSMPLISRRESGSVARSRRRHSSICPICHSAPSSRRRPIARILPA